MWNTICLSVVGLVVIWISNWIRRWRNPKCNGVLPPGSMGFPLIGETLPLIIPAYSLDLHPFIKNRLQRYGPIFRTSIVGRPVVISADPEFNNFLFQQEGSLVELYYLDTFSKIFVHEGVSRTNEFGVVHKYIRSIFLNHFGAERLKEKLLPEIEQMVNKTLSAWSAQASVEVKHAASVLVLNFSAKQIISYDAKKSSESLSETYTRIIQGFMSFPLNIPGTAYNQCVKLIFGGLFATFESVSAVLALGFMLLAEHPSVLEEMIAEHETILKNREHPNSLLAWGEYKSMTFTLQVINETLRLGNVSPGLLRKALKDIRVKGFTIPKGWAIMMVTSALQLSPSTFKNPLEFNPRRWKDLDSLVISKNFMPFGRGMRQCAGAEYSRAFMATFFHVLLTKYRWTTIKMGNVSRNPILRFGNGIHIKFSKKN